jgi:hypothetical protein
VDDYNSDLLQILSPESGIYHGRLDIDWHSRPFRQRGALNSAIIAEYIISGIFSDLEHLICIARINTITPLKSKSYIFYNRRHLIANIYYISRLEIVEGVSDGVHGLERRESLVLEMERSIEAPLYERKTSQCRVGYLIICRRHLSTNNSI